MTSLPQSCTEAAANSDGHLPNKPEERGSPQEYIRMGGRRPVWQSAPFCLSRANGTGGFYLRNPISSTLYGWQLNLDTYLGRYGYTQCGIHTYGSTVPEPW